MKVYTLASDHLENAIFSMYISPTYKFKIWRIFEFILFFLSFESLCRKIKVSLIEKKLFLC